MYVSDILKGKSGETVSVRAKDSIPAALKLMSEHRIGAVLVLDDAEKIAGILSERDLVRSMNRLGLDVFSKSVGDLMTKNVMTCTPKDHVAAIMGMMTQQRFRHVPVVDDGKLIGIISIGDVVKSRIEEAESEVDELKRYISL